jgi:diguanylate cyclase (GGDEF)-like protein
LIYIEEDATGARKLIYGLVLANITLSSFSVLLGFHIDSPATVNFFELPRELFFQSPRIWLIGTLALIFDTIFLIIIFELVSRYISSLLFVRIYLTMVIVLTLDSFLFVTGSFFEKPEYWTILISAITGKSIMSFFYATVLTVYFRFLHQLPDDTQQLAIKDIFNFLTYRQKYEALRESSIKDSLTGVYNRGFFEKTLPQELDKARRARQSMSVILVDLDHFKAVNDRFGHREGDLVLSTLGDILTGCLRSTDFAFRYGGEEFALILTNTESAVGLKLAERIRTEIKRGLLFSRTGSRGFGVTATLGLATFPAEARTGGELIMLADKRLYAGKRAGRDRVVHE